MPPPTVKKIHGIPFKNLADSARIKITGVVNNPEFRYALAYPVAEAKSKITEPKKIPEVSSSVADVKDIALARAYAASAGSTLLLSGTVPTTVLMGAGKRLRIINIFPIKENLMMEKSLREQLLGKLLSHLPRKLRSNVLDQYQSNSLNYRMRSFPIF